MLFLQVLMDDSENNLSMNSKGALKVDIFACYQDNMCYVA